MSAPDPSPTGSTDRAPAAWPAVSVVMPVLNEERHLREAVERVLAQDYPGDLELVVALGPSHDRTDEIAGELQEQYPDRLRTVRNPTGATPAGLNLAVAAARHGIVVRVDGHSLFPLDYVRTGVSVLEQTGADNVGGIMAAEGVTAFEQAVARAMTSPFGVGNARFHVGGEAGPADTVYLGTFRRSALERVGGYDPTYLRAQDWEMNLRIRRAGGLVWFTPRMRVSYRPRGSVAALARQYFDYGRWRRRVMREHEGTANLRYLAPPLAVLGVLAGLVVTPVWWPAAALPGGYLVVLVAASAVTGKGLPPSAWLRLPVVYATMHGAWGIGFLTSPRRLAAGPGAAAPGGTP